MYGVIVLGSLVGCTGGFGPSPLVAQSSSVSAERSSLSRETSLDASVVLPGVGRAIVPDRSDGFANPNAARIPAIVISDYGLNDLIAIDAANGQTIAKITGFDGPQGLAGDKAGNIYVANTYANNVLVYKNDYKTLLASLRDPRQYPAGVAVDTNSGLVAVTNFISTAGGAGSISFFRNGTSNANKPCVTVSNSNFARVFFGAFDAAGNLFIDGQNADGSVVVGEIAKASCRSTSINVLTTGNTIFFPGGVQVSPTGEIAIDDQLACVIYSYKTAEQGGLGLPVSTTPLYGSNDPVTFSFTHTAQYLWTADPGGLGAHSFEFLYPQGGVYEGAIIGFSEPVGVVVTPLERP